MQVYMKGNEKVAGGNHVSMEENVGRINWISVSGGKDSTALLLWSIEEELPNCRYVYADTQHEHPSVYEYLTYLEDETGVHIERVQSEGFLEMCKRKGRFPSTKARFCTESLKIIPIAKHIESASPGETHRIFVGVRAEESPARADLPPSMMREVKFPPRQCVKQEMWHPLLRWDWKEVFAIHKRSGIKPNPLYKMGMNRVGCFPCVMARRQELKTMFKKFPEVVDKIRQWEEEVGEDAKARGNGEEHSFFPWAMFPVGAEPGGIDAFVALLDDGPELPGLEQDLGGCMSIYGLCE